MLFKINSIIILFLLVEECLSISYGYCNVGRFNNKFFNGKNIKTTINYKNKRKKSYGLYGCKFDNKTTLNCKLNIPSDFDDDISFEFEPINKYYEKYLIYHCNCNYTDTTLSIVKKSKDGQYEYTNTIDMFDENASQKMTYVFGNGKSACKLNYHIKKIKGKSNSMTHFSNSNLAQYSSKGICVIMGNLYTTLSTYYRAKSMRYLIAGLSGGLLCSGAVDLFYKLLNKFFDSNEPDYKLVLPEITES